MLLSICNCNSLEVGLYSTTHGYSVECEFFEQPAIRLFKDLESAEKYFNQLCAALTNEFME